ncbi:hypothetical protein [Streptomyces sp. IB201691-2A2]|uniref:hypothetical protein n=1 Tax=Streptomyces sp. IB201691-2A2 TaxID=2561920 RepID=UPI00117EDFDB|nr:hypothetical protein [Streptomyces sp. IB201691-2A2]TRO55506.1 hypothetical protein E4K73_50335 [Streptomyces sp. IB201691-2A2]
MSAHRASPAQPWPGWSTSRAAQAAYGKHLVRIGELIPALLYMHVMDRRDLAAAHTARRQDSIDTQVRGLALECRDDLLQTAAVLDAIALCHGHGSYLPRPYTDESLDRAPAGVELRTDASDLASELVRHDHEHGTSTTDGIPSALGEDCTDADRDAVRAYARREWIASQERRP